MFKPLRIIIIAIILIMSAGVGYLMLNNSSDKSDNAISISQQNNAPAQSEAEKLLPSGKYVDYSAEAVAATTGQRILFFHASWCPQCRQLDASIKSGSIPNDITIFKVDYDDNQKLRQKYGVTIQTTLVLLDSNGNEAKKYVAYDEPNLSAVVENLL